MTGMELMRDVASVVFVLGLLAGALYFLRARARTVGGSASEVKLKVTKRISLTPNHTLHLVETDWKTLLIATHPSGLTLIDQSTPSEAAIECARRLDEACRV